MSYKQQTKNFQFPVLGYGDTIEPSTELSKWQMVENFFLSCMRGEETAIFQEGEMALEPCGVNGVMAVMYDSGNGIICRGITSGRYFNATRPIKWVNLKPGKFYYLNISTTNMTFDDPSDFDVSVSEVSICSGKTALVATVDLRGDTYTIDRYPVGKNCPTMLSRHIEDNEDPHGELLHQTNIDVRNRLDAKSASIDELRVKTLVVGNTEVRFDGNHYHDEIEEVDIPAGDTVLTGENIGEVVYAQCLDPRIVFTISNGSVTAKNDTGGNVHTTLMLTFR